MDLNNTIDLLDPMDLHTQLESTATDYGHCTLGNVCDYWFDTIQDLYIYIRNAVD